MAIQVNDSPLASRVAYLEEVVERQKRAILAQNEQIRAKDQKIAFLEGRGFTSSALMRMQSISG